jgi:VWFA-related protein
MTLTSRGVPGRLLTLVLSCALGAAPILAQETYTERLDVEIVNVDVVVTDRKGEYIRGLTASDFVVLEDGRPQVITNFSEFAEGGNRVSAEDAPAHATSPEDHAPRTIAFFFDQLALTPWQLDEMMRGIEQFLAAAVVPGDQVTVATWRGRKMDLRVERTADHARARRALTTLKQELRFGGVKALADEKVTDQMIDAERFADENSAAMSARHGIPALETGRERLGYCAGPHMQYLETRSKVRALNSFLTSIGGLEGKKIVVLAMRRFDLQPGRITRFDGPPRNICPEFDTYHLADSLIRTANAYGIALHTFHAAGLGKTMPTAESTGPANDGGAGDYLRLMGESSGLDLVASSTGGRIGLGPVQLARELSRVAEDARNYYSLGYRANAGKEGPRRIKVKVPDRRVRVRARKSVIPLHDRQVVRDLVVANLQQPTASSAIDLEVRAGQSAKSGFRRLVVSIEVEIPVHQLIALPDASGRLRGAFSVLIAAGNRRIGGDDVVERRQEFSLEADPSAHPKTFTYQIDIRTNPATRRIAVAVVDETSESVGYATVDLPDPATVTSRSATGRSR